MYKCKECNAEYEIKPDYCDCGNDTFDEIKIENLNTQTSEKEIKKENIKKDKNTATNNTTINKNIKHSEIKPYAIIIFISCLILSIIVILFAWNPKQTEDLKIEKQAETIEKNIPSIEKIWNNKLPTQSQKTTAKTKTEVQNNTLKQVTPITSKTNVNSTKVQNAVKPAAKAASKTVTKQTATKPAASKTKTSTQKPITKQSTPIKQPLQTKKTVSTPIKQTTPSITPQTKTASAQEISNYKIKLRNHIASKIAFASVVGDGNCTFSFSVGKNGELTNKKPVALSDNDSLNEAVYNALRQVYSYNPPPEGYKTETLKFTVKMYNNNFEVYLK